MSEGKVTELPTNVPHVDPRVTNKSVQDYAKRMASKSGPQKYSVPVAGGKNPPIPRLDQQHVDGLTMAAAAEAQRGQQQMPSIVEPSMPQGPQLQPNDQLPPEATQDPTFQQGFSSMYATSQPHLAMKYGVIRNGQRVPAQMLQPGFREGQGGLSPKTIEGLQAIHKLNEQSQRAGEVQAQAADTAAEDAAKMGVAGAARTLGTPPKVNDDVRKGMENLDAFDIDGFRTMMAEEMLNTEEQRKLIEERLQPLSIGDLVMQGYVQQIIPIVPGSFEPELRSLSSEEDLACKRLIVGEAKGLDVQADRYLLDKYAIMGMTCALVKVHRTLPPLPSHLGEDGNFRDELFWVKFNKVCKLPLPMISSLGVHYFWFDVRVRKLFRVERLKNG